MTKRKVKCQRHDCQRLVYTGKIKRSVVKGDFICQICYYRENRHRFDENNDSVPQINGAKDISMEKMKKVGRMAKIKKWGVKLLRGEDEVIRSKYSFNKFVTGEDKCNELKRLKDGIKDSVVKNEKNIKKEFLKKESSKKENDEFLKGLLQK